MPSESSFFAVSINSYFLEEKNEMNICKLCLRKLIHRIFDVKALTIVIQ